MSTRTFALIFGIVFLLVGVAGFVPALVEEPTAGAAADQEHMLLLGLFPINTIHNAVHLLFGVWGLLAYRSLAGSVTYARAVAIIYLLLAIFGFIPTLDTLFGLAPLYGNVIWLHLGLAAVAAYFGWVHRNPANA